MSSLYKRATPRQNQVLRMIEGAIANACHAHPELQISPRHRRSISKRAAGTLTAGWPAVLAWPLAASDGQGGHVLLHPDECLEIVTTSKRRRAASHRQKRSPLVQYISAQCGPAKAAGQTERYETLIEILRFVSQLPS